MKHLITIVLLFISATAFSQAGAGIRYVDTIPTHTPNPMLRHSTVVRDLSKDQLYNFDRNEWKRLTNETEILFAVDSIEQIVSMDTTVDFRVGDRIINRSTGAQYLIQPDSVAGYETDTVAVTPVGSSYAVLQPQNGAYDVKWFGAAGDSITDDTESLQLAFDFINGSPSILHGQPSSVFNFPNSLLLSKGVYVTTIPLQGYSGIKLIGEGTSTIIRASDSFVGNSIIELTFRSGQPSYFSNGLFKNIAFDGPLGVWAIQAISGVVLNSKFEDITLWTNKGIDLGTYTQAVRVFNILSLGEVDQILHLKGNANEVIKIDKEGATGSTSDPYILVEDHAGESGQNTFRGILIEQTTSANKTSIKFLNCNSLLLDNFWTELSLSSGFALELENCKRVSIERYRTFDPDFKINIINSKQIYFDYVDVSSGDWTIDSVIVMDTASSVIIDHVYCFLQRDLLSLEKPNLVINNIYSTTVDSENSWHNPNSRNTQWKNSGNILKNPSFQAGRFAWTFSSIPNTTEEYISSEVSDGKMGHFVWSTTASRTFGQDIPAIANIPITVTAVVKCEVGTHILVFLSGDETYTQNIRATEGSGWQTITNTIIPKANGTVSAGVYFINSSDVYVDEISASYTPSSTLNSSNFKSINLDNKNIVYNSAVPTTGTWQIGDKVFNNDPSVSEFAGWVCTVAGSPGTWEGYGTVGGGASTLYGADGTIGSGRIATITDDLTFQGGPVIFGSNTTSGEVRITNSSNTWNHFLAAGNYYVRPNTNANIYLRNSASSDRFTFNLASTYLGIGTNTPAHSLDILGNAATQLRFATSSTDAAVKQGYIDVRHYTNAEEDFSLLFGDSQSGTSILNLGGGTATGNAATQLSFWTAANNTTTTGTERLRINPTGEVNIADMTDQGAYNLQVEGDTYLDDNITIGANSIYVPSATTSIVAGTGITVANTIMRIDGSGGAVDITADPQIADGTDGQLVMIKGQNDTNTVTLDDGTGLQLAGAASIVLGLGDIITLMYDSVDDLWIEISRSDN